MAAMVTALLVLLLAAPAVLGETYTVGWDSNVNYDDWVSGKTFTVGDSLKFEYTDSHSVDEVDEDGYKICNSANAIKSHTGTTATIGLTKAGTRYFICPTAGHCVSGMALKVVVVANTSPTTPTTTATPPPPSATPSSPGSPTVNATTPTISTVTDSSPPPPPSPSAAEGTNSVGVSVVLATLLLAFVA